MRLYGDRLASHGGRYYSPMRYCMGEICCIRAVRQCRDAKFCVSTEVASPRMVGAIIRLCGIVWCNMLHCAVRQCRDAKFCVCTDRALRLYGPEPAFVHGQDFLRIHESVFRFALTRRELIWSPNMRQNLRLRMSKKGFQLSE